MMTELRVTLKSKFTNKYKRGYPLLTKDVLQHDNAQLEEGALLRVFDEGNQFIGKAYYGLQNKGVGWMISDNENEKIDEAFFKNKMSSAFNHRKLFFKDTSTTAFRVFNGEGDGLGGLTIDYFDGFYLIQWYNEGIYSFKDQNISALTELVTYKGIYQKKRFDKKGQYIEDDDFITGERGAFPIFVKENDVNIAVHLNDGAMVGVFLDQREVRKRIRDTYASGKTVLNTFSYTGVFSVFAALGGALSTTSVDLANRSKPKTIEQFSCNGIDYEAQHIIVQDVFNFFKFAVKKELKYDLVILDPPSFARSKKHTFSAAKDYKDLLKDAISVTEKNGVIVASTNASNFDMKKFKGFIEKAFKESNKAYHILEEFTLPADFKTIPAYKEGNYLKVLFIKKRD
ncbi:class I SAM-dependent rRNA methyltransferase [Evansella cellulosilytica]|uniref:rRNA (Guanine-N(2)-)-methyltransferase n=1 Tax=Evansella cellulosilytica (strain ATCC 21833 / DSM 2522 / FERM P-1141 / JCM 9156 / N-4) TaxID=649639 RepID=E6TZ14_EVAC2|nr:class I SAM-dependent rRNA methyltransferase [Evansella cellulosilytica]ADU32457.1 rRNA (guanine-N(2)-)-methyltransferase [Evansella cellulosilytica DSM 2522]